MWILGLKSVGTCRNSDVAWAISTVVDAQPLVSSAAGDAKKPAAFTAQPSGDLSALQSSSRTQLLPGATGSFSPLRP